MKIGLLIYEASEAEFAFLHRHGFQSCQIVVRPGGLLDPRLVTDDTIKRVRDRLQELGIELSALGYYGNNLDPDPARRAERQEFLRGLLRLAPKLGTTVVGTFAGRDPERSIADNITAFKEFFAPLAREAEDLGVRIAFENCPMFHSFPFRGINIAYTPVAWELMFDAVPSPALGLEYDPSHLVCLLIDYLEVVYHYGSRIFHVHAKDAEVCWRNVRRNGIFEEGAVRHRMPGLGEVNWARLASALVENGYRGNLDIEGRHDPVYRDALEEQGLLIALRHLRQAVGA